MFFAPQKPAGGGYWLPELAKEIEQATAFVLLVGEKGLGPWQVIEYYEALDKRVKANRFSGDLVLLDGQPAPGLPFLRAVALDHHRRPGVGEGLLAQAIGGGRGRRREPGELWRYTAPYRGLAAMTEADSDFFFGRGHEDQSK